MEDRGAPSQRLRDGLQQQEILGAGQNEVTGPVGLVDNAQDVREQLRGTLSLVQDDGAVELGQKPLRVVQREITLVRKLERDVPVTLERAANERCLARLPGPGDGHHRVASDGFAQSLCQGPRYHG
jgi:hypothetical protein